MKKFTSILLVFLLTLSLSAVAFGQSLMVYSALHEYEIARILDAFSKETGIPTDFIRASAGEIVARVSAESAAPRADIFLGGPGDSHAVLIPQGALLPYQSPTAADIDDFYLDPEYHWNGFYLGALGIAINTERFEAEIQPLGLDYPKTWEDLLDPAYKNEIVVANANTSGTGYTFAVNHLRRLGEEAGWDFLDAFHENVHHYTRSGAAPARMVGAGEFIIGITFGHDILKPLSAGYPLKLVYPPNVAWEIGGVSIIKGGPNEEAAKKFIDWVLGQEAGQLHSDLSMRISTRTDVSLPPGATPLEEIVLIDYFLDWAADNRVRVLDEWSNRYE